MKKREKELLKKRIIRVLLLLISVVSLLSGLLITTESLDIKGKNKKELLLYNTIGSIDYEIDLHTNDFYEDNKDLEHVITKYINTITINPKYTFSSSKNVDLSASYKVKLYLVNSYFDNNEEKIIWSKEYELIPEINKEEKDSSLLVIDDKVIIDYNYYSDIAKKFRSESGILTSSYLQIEFMISSRISSSKENYSFDNNSTVKMKIPLLENITSIEKENEFDIKDVYYDTQVKKIDSIKLVIGILLFLISLAFLYTSAKMFLDLEDASNYVKEQTKILKRFPDVIAETSTRPDLSNLEIIEIINFIDLINIEDELRIPILFYELVKGKESWFLIIHNNKAYRYTLKKKKNQ